MVQMENGATILLESSWALNTLQVGEAQTVLCGTKAGADMLDGLRINGERLGKLYTVKPELHGGGAAFFDASADEDPGLAEAKNFVAAVKGEGKTLVKPEQALVVTEILEAIYQSARSGQPVFFN
jgi:predicted dehydrogenase